MFPEGVLVLLAPLRIAAGLLGRDAHVLGHDLDCGGLARPEAAQKAFCVAMTSSIDTTIEGDAALSNLPFALLEMIVRMPLRPLIAVLITEERARRVFLHHFFCQDDEPLGFDPDDTHILGFAFTRFKSPAALFHMAWFRSAARP